MVLGLRTKILIPCATIVAATVAAVCVFAVYRVGLVLERKDLELFSSRADHLAEASIEAATTGNPHQLPALIPLLQREPGSRWLVIHDEAGQPLLSWSREAGSRPLELLEPLHPLPTDRALIDGGKFGMPGTYELRVPIVVGGLVDASIDTSKESRAPPRIRGLVRLGISMEPARSEARKTTIGMLIASALVALVGVIFVYVFSRHVTEPVWEMVERTAEFSDGRFGQIEPIPTTREFAILARSFNVMADRMAHFHREIRRQNQLLERRVRERTEDLQLALEELKRLDQLKDDFLSNVSHELRTPMTSIRSFAEILRDYADDDPKMRTEFLDIIVSESERLSRLIEDFLDLAKIESGLMNWKFRPFAIGEAVQRVVQSLQATAACSGVELAYELIDPVPELNGDRDRLHQVWNNLVSNALKFTPEGKAVRVTVHGDAAQVIVEVKDQGPGIPPDLCEAVFERFRQVGTDLTTDKPKGTGLGLAISRDIVVRHGGRIELDSEVDVGSTFLVVLPIRTLEELERDAPLSVARQLLSSP